MTLVVDGSVITAALVDSGPDGTWADSVLRGEPLVAPHLLPVEVANVLRRSTLAGGISADTATTAYADLLELRIGLFAYAPFAERVWELRGAITAYDAWYVALAETLDVPLATLDHRLSRAPGPRCSFVTPAFG